MANHKDGLFLPPPRILTRGGFSISVFLAFFAVAFFAAFFCASPVLADIVITPETDLSTAWTVSNSNGVTLDGNDLSYANHTGALTISSDPIITLTNGAVFEQSGSVTPNGKAIKVSGNGTFNISGSSGHGSASNNPDRLVLYGFYFTGGGNPTIDTTPNSNNILQGHNFLMLSGSSQYGILRFENDGEFIIGRNTYPNTTSNSTAILVNQNANAKLRQSSSQYADPNSGLNLVDKTVEFKIEGALESSARIFDEPEKYGDNTGSLIKSGSGTITITNSNNTYVKPTSITEGKLVLSGAGNLTATSGVSIASGATLEFKDNDADGEGGAVTFTRPISGAGNLVKSGTGTVNLSASNSYTGTTTISGGTLKISNVNGLGTGPVTINGGKLDASGAGSGKEFNYDLIIGDNGGAVTVAGSDYSSFSSISGSGDLTTSGYVHFNGTGGYSGDLTVNGGYTRVTPGAFGVFNLTLNDGRFNSVGFSGTIQIGKLNSPIGDYYLFGSDVNNEYVFEIGVNTTSTDESTFGYAIRGTNNGAYNVTIKKVGEGTQIFNHNGYGFVLFNHNYAYNSLKEVIVDQGTMIIDAVNSSDFAYNKAVGYWGSAPITVNPDATLEFKQAWTVAPNSLMTINGGTLTLDNTQYINKLTLNSGTINGAGNVQVGFHGNADWNVKGGVTTINNKVVLVKNDSSTTFTINFDKDATLNITKDVYSHSTLSGMELIFKGTGDGPGNVNLTSTAAMTKVGNITFNNMNGTIASAITGESAVTKTGAGTVTLTGANDYTGATTVSGGTLKLTGSGTLGTGTVTVGDNGTLEFNVAEGQTKELTVREQNAIFSTGKVIKTGDGRLKIDAAEGTVDAQSLVISSGRVDIKEYFNGQLEVKSGATFSPGNSVGSLTINSQDIVVIGESTYGGGFILTEEGATLLMEIGGSDVTDNDVLIVQNGNILLGDGIIELAMTDDCPLGLGESFTAVLSAENSGEGLDVLGHIQTSDFTDLKYVLLDSGTYSGLYAITGRRFNANEVPEPSTWALLLLGAAGLLYVRKRNK
jgi:autotransporter-associated beta strand protein